MILLQVTDNTAVQVVDTVIDSVPTYTNTGIGVLLSAIFMPLLILGVFSLAKAIVAVGIDDIDKIDFFAEMAIDCLSILSSFIIGRFILEINPQSVLITAFNLLFLMIVSLGLLCLLRRNVMKMRKNSDVDMKKVKRCVVFEYVVDAICLGLIVILL